MNNLQTLLIVDDSQLNRELLMEILGTDYRYLQAEDGQQAIDILRGNPAVDLMLLDMVMPGLDGCGVLEIMQRYHWLDEIPVIVISADQSDAFMDRAYSLGATDYIHRPFHTLVVRRRIENTLMLYAKQRRLTSLVSQQVLDKEKLSSMLLGIFGSVVEAHNGENNQHILRVRTITEALLHQLAKETPRYRLTEEEIIRIGMASALHDIGKSRVPEAILKKPGPLTAEERAIMETHTTVGAAIIKDLPAWQDDPLVKTAYDICRWHHERWDGNGYPDHLKGEAIPISAQAVSLADVYSALTAQRPYKPALSHETAIQMIRDGKCGSFNPLLLKCLTDISPQLVSQRDLMLGDRDDVQDSLRLSNELLKIDGEDNILPGGKSLLQQTLEAEREKTAFYAAQCGGVQFDYNIPSRQVRVVDWFQPPDSRERTFSIDAPDLQDLMSLEDLHKLWTLAKEATPEDPERSMDVYLTVRLTRCLFRLTARVIWSHGADPQPLSVIVQFSDLKGEAVRRGTLSLRTQGDAFNIVSTTLRELKDVFDIVRLVDPANNCVLRLNEDGSLSPGGACTSIWGRDEVCKNCISAKAMKLKTRLCRLEFTETDIFHVTAQYVELNGQPCVLELISKIDNGRWLDSGDKRLLLENAQAPSDDSAQTDTLTGVRSRYYLEQTLGGQVEVDGVALIDADLFKSVNDTYGHQAGDAALRTIASVISSCVRSSDILIRYGGDEFLLLFPRIPKATFQLRLEQIRKAVSAVSVPDYPELRLSVTVGGAYGVKPLDEAIRQADRQMYRRKAQRAQP